MSFNLVLATKIPDPDNEGEFIDSTSTIACRAELSGNGTLTFIMLMKMLLKHMSLLNLGNFLIQELDKLGKI